ncbi:hypothetical protein BFP78_02200 [Gaetbulibacter sp. 5U11]|nr:hypothetical protein BFP78_02200 [Gaetbulibacter sp. 5U11]
MYKEFFKNLAEKENGQFYFTDENISIGMGVRSPNVIYKITFTYKDNLFTIINQTGTNYITTIRCQLNDTLHPIPFTVNTTSHLKNLFLQKKSRLNVTTEHLNLKDFLSKNNALNILSEIANKEKFDPNITCQYDNVWSIETNYHLEFDNWTDPIEPIIELYKNLINHF